MLKSIFFSIVSIVRSTQNFIKTFIKTLWQALRDRPDEWNSEQALQLGNSLSTALGYELPEAAPSRWDTEKLTQMSENLAHIHPGL
ncbi:MAG: hypothetical protein KME07_24125 [Pegethrix bostrychoides GSE-TBD4-15B]|jgi:hypothetical protein|uniref:Uncharacterized protein n=1 Tax=Pegethrix bostrychoides GSE-TBD4-15B TaxID=2839662 RepID=A0A951U792_9CYAN|nr:hypothetical protein [Pegethrix bostrychoides GSE-TBD4-15B]